MYTDVANVKTDLQKLLDFSPDVICTIDAERKFVTVSAAAKTHTHDNNEQAIKELTKNYLLII